MMKVLEMSKVLEIFKGVRHKIDLSLIVVSLEKGLLMPHAVDSFRAFLLKQKDGNDNTCNDETKISGK